MKLELLSPAKNLEFGREAINHGADALYIGAPAFGARAAATNTLEDIDQDILDIFEEAQTFTGKAEPGVEGFSPVAEMREFIGDHDE